MKKIAGQYRQGDVLVERTFGRRAEQYAPEIET